MYVCTVKNYHRGKLYKRGDHYTPLADEKVPLDRFEEVGGVSLPPEPTPRLGAKVKGEVPGKEKPSMKAPGKDASKAE